MARFHPQIELLTEHAAGVLPVAQSACVAAHLNYCPECRCTVTQLQDVGAALFESSDAVPVGDTLLKRVLARLDEDAPLHYATATDRNDSATTPALLQRLMQGDFSDLPWRKITDALRITRLRTGDPGHEFTLFHIKAGGVIPEHRHRGNEMTLVLEGGFSDDQGSYHPGDFICRRPGELHAPKAFADQDCICLAVLDAPLRFTGWKYRWINPFLRLHTG